MNTYRLITGLLALGIMTACQPSTDAPDAAPKRTSATIPEAGTSDTTQTEPEPEARPKAPDARIEPMRWRGTAARVPHSDGSILIADQGDTLASAYFDLAPRDDANRETILTIEMSDWDPETFGRLSFGYPERTAETTQVFFNCEEQRARSNDVTISAKISKSEESCELEMSFEIPADRRLRVALAPVAGKDSPNIDPAIEGSILIRETVLSFTAARS